MNILLIDTRVSHSEAIVAAIDPALSLGITFDYYTDTFDTLKERIVLAIREHSGGANANLANSVGLVQHSYKMSTFKIVDAQTTPSIIEQVETQDRELSTWGPLKEFIEWCKTELSTAHFDMMACSLYSNPDWKYVIDALSVQTGVEIRASTDATGSSLFGGNWFLESHVGVNLKEVYFNDSIDDYKGLLVALSDVKISKKYKHTFIPKQLPSPSSYVVPMINVDLRGFPVLNNLTSWTIDIVFTVKSNLTVAGGGWRALLGSMYYDAARTRGWGIWVSDINQIFYSQSTNYFTTGLSVSLNIPYNLNIVKDGTTVTFTLTNISANTSLTPFTNSNVTDLIGTGPVSIGGWPLIASEDFPGTISSVVVKEKKIQVTTTSASTGTITYSNPSPTSSVASISSTGLITINNTNNVGTVTFTASQAPQGSYPQYSWNVILDVSEKVTPDLTSVTMSKVYDNSVTRIPDVEIPKYNTGFPQLSDYPTKWTMDIGFCVTGGTNDGFRGLVGSCFNTSENDFIWGVWVSQIDTIFFTDYTNTYYLEDLKVIWGNDYNLNLTKVGSTIFYTLTNKSNNTSISRTGPTNAIGIGPVSIGGWRIGGTSTGSLKQKFEGIIYYVLVKEANFSIGDRKVFYVTPPPSISDGTMHYAYQSGNSAVASITDWGLITIPASVTVGRILFTASQDESSSYNASSTSATVTLDVLKGTRPLIPLAISKMFGTTLGPVVSTLSSPTLTKLLNVQNNGFPVLNSLPNWTIEIGFTQTTLSQGSWRALLGSMYYDAASTRGWGIWITSYNQIYYSQSINNFSTGLSVSPDVQYNLNIAKVGTTVTFTLTNISTGASSIYTKTNVTDSIGTGPVSIGGWSLFGNEDFQGRIWYIEVKNYFSMGGKTFQVTAPQNSDAATIYYGNPTDTSVASITPTGLITITNNKAGTVIFSATQPETIDYREETVYVTLTVYVLPGTIPTITITNSSISKTTVDTTPFSIGYTSTSSEGAITFSSNNSNVASIDAFGNITIKGIVGSATFTVSQAASPNYNAAADKTATLTVTIGTPTITISNSSISKTTVDTTPFSIGYTTPSDGTLTFSSNASNIATIDASGNITIKGIAGSATFTVSQAASPNYNKPSDKTAMLIVSRGTPTITIPNLPSTKTTVDTTPFSIGYTTQSDGTLTFSSNASNIATIDASGNITIKGIAGSAIFTVSQASSPNYNAAADKTATLIVSKGTPTLTDFPNLSKTFGTSPFSITPPTSENKTVGTFRYISSDINVATIDNLSGLVTILNVGFTDITVSQVETTNFFAPVNTIIAKLTVTKGTPVLSTSFTISSKTTIDKTVTFTPPTSSISGPLYFSSVNTDVATIDSSSGVITIKGIVGTAKINVLQKGTTNYNDSNTVSATLIVSKGTPTITISNLPSTKSITDDNFQLQYTFQSGGGTLEFSSSNSSVATINSSGFITILGVGTTDIKVSQLESINYAYVFLSKTLTVNLGTNVSSGADLSGKNLNGVDLSGVNITGIDFTNASIVGAINLPNFSIKQKLQLLYNANNAGANIPQLQFLAPLSVSELNEALNVPIPELSSVQTEFLVAAPVYVNGVKTVTIAESSISALNNTSLYIPLNKSETVKINGVSYTLNESNQLLDSKGVVLNLMVINGYQFKIYTGSIIAVNISNIINNITFDAGNTIKLYDVIISIMSGSTISENVSNSVNNITFDAANAIKLYDVINTMIQAAAAQQRLLQ